MCVFIYIYIHMYIYIYVYTCITQQLGSHLEAKRTRNPKPPPKNPRGIELRAVEDVAGR